MRKYCIKDDVILEIGAGDGRNVDYLKNHSDGCFPLVMGIDKVHGTALDDIPLARVDVVYTMSTLFLIDPLPAEQIANMVRKYLITIEGETTKGEVIGRNYKEVFEPLGFTQIYHEEEVFNKFGVARVFKKTS